MLSFLCAKGFDFVLRFFNPSVNYKCFHDKKILVSILEMFKCQDF